MKWFLASVVGTSVASAAVVPPSFKPIGPLIPTTVIKAPRHLSITTTTTQAASTTSTVAAANPMVYDKFLVKNLKASKNGHEHDIVFTVDDLSTAPEEKAKCHIHWHGPHVRRGPTKCDDGWFTASVTYWDDPQSFGLQINHAYGETCVGCNDEDNEDFDGDVGTCTVALDEDKMTNMKSGNNHWEATAERDISCFVDFDNATL